MLVATAVALSVAAASVGAWFLVRRNLREQVDASLALTPIPAQLAGGGYRDSREDSPFRPSPRTAPFFAIVTPGGSAVAIGTSRDDVLQIRPGDRAAAAAADGSRALRDDRTTAGVHVRVMTTSLPSGYAFLAARPLTETDESLDKLRLLLLLVGGLGIVGSAGAGLAVAQAGLRPVDRLTAKAEDIARTEVLGDPLEVSGHDEVARLSSAFNKMTAALDSSRQRQAQLVSDAGHELRTPLTSLRTNIDLLLRAESRPERLGADDRSRLLQDLDSQVDELSSLATELVELARGDRAMESSPIDLLQPVSRAVERATARAGDARIDAHLESWACVGDAGLLERAAVNLLDNALKFGPPMQVVRVALVGGVLSVLDQGPGIPEEDLLHVTERFWRAPSSRSRPGSGLGLSIAAQVAHQHGGRLEVSNHSDGGLLVRLHVPMP
jgi:two-component system sensor histidine kinase MprB